MVGLQKTYYLHYRKCIGKAPDKRRYVVKAEDAILFRSFYGIGLMQCPHLGGRRSKIWRDSLLGCGVLPWLYQPGKISKLTRHKQHNVPSHFATLRRLSHYLGDATVRCITAWQRTVPITACMASAGHESPGCWRVITIFCRPRLTLPAAAEPGSILGRAALDSVFRFEQEVAAQFFQTKYHLRRAQ